jgi:virginiamycin B lyase
MARQSRGRDMAQCNIFYTGNHQGLVGKLDPRTGEVTEYRMPDPNAKDPHSLAFAPDGMLFFTLQRSNMVGRLDLRSGKVTEWPSPGGPKSEPYGIVFAKGVIWYSESGTRLNTIVRFDPKAETFQTWAIPSGGYIVRKMDVTSDGNPVIAPSTVNGVGLVEVK